MGRIENRLLVRVDPRIKPEERSFVAAQISKIREVISVDIHRDGTPIREFGTHPDRPVGEAYDLFLDDIRVSIGDRVDPKDVLHGHYEIEPYWHRTNQLRLQVKYYAQWAKDNKKRGKRRGRICAGHKRVIREYMNVIDNAYEVEVSGVYLSFPMNDRVVPQSYLGKSQGVSTVGMGDSVSVNLVFRAIVPHPSNLGEFRHVAINITNGCWTQPSVLRALLKTQKAA